MIILFFVLLLSIVFFFFAYALRNSRNNKIEIIPLEKDPENPQIPTISYDD